MTIALLDLKTGNLKWQTVVDKAKSLLSFHCCLMVVMLPTLQSKWTNNLLFIWYIFFQ
jgi:hypothetical protein